MTNEEKERADFKIFLCDENKEVRDMATKKNFNLAEAVRQYEELSAIPEVVEIAFRRQMAESDRKSNEIAAKNAGMEAGMKAGMEAGMKAGVEKGMILKQKEIVKNLLKQKVNIQVIMQVTGLTKEEVEQC